MDYEQAIAADKFTITELTASINNSDVPKTRIQELKLFEEKGVRTTTVYIEYKDGQVQLVEDVERGEDGKPLDDPDRNLYPFTAVHLPIPGRISADDLTNTRAFGTEDELESLQVVIDEKSEIARLSLDVTLEYFRLGAIFGKVIGKKGNVIVDLFKVFGLKESDAESKVDFNKPLRSQLVQIKRDSEKYQKGIKAKKYRAFCTAEYMDHMMDDPSFEKAFDRYNDGEKLRDDVRNGVFWQNTYWEEYDTSVGDKDFLKEKGYGAIVFPDDKRGLFKTRFAPANYNDTVGTIGLPYYQNAEPLPMKKGMSTESQSNPINVCTSPLSCRRIKFTAKSGS